jgi:hypothetical protein
MISTIDKASFVRENYPDNSILKLGEQFVKTFEIKFKMILSTVPRRSFFHMRHLQEKLSVFQSL